jgi:primosomal replication protein N
VFIVFGSQYQVNELFLPRALLNIRVEISGCRAETWPSLQLGSRLTMAGVLRSTTDRKNVHSLLQINFTVL